MKREEALDVALGDRGAIREGVGDAHAATGRGPIGGRVDGLARARHGARNRRPAARAHRRDLRPEASGKTTLVYHVMAEAQRHGGICAFIDAEHAMDPLVRAPRSASTSTSCSSRSPTPASRRSRSLEHLIRSRCPRRRRDRLGRGPRPQGGDRGGDGRLARRAPGAAHEPGARGSSPARSTAPTRSGSSSRTRSARRSESCSATRRRRPAAAR